MRSSDFRYNAEERMDDDLFFFMISLPRTYCTMRFMEINRDGPYSFTLESKDGTFRETVEYGSETELWKVVDQLREGKNGKELYDLYRRFCNDYSESLIEEL